MKKIFKVLILVFILILLSGCQNYAEINNYAIVSGISIDKGEKNPNNYTVGIQIMNAKKDEESDNSLITFYKSSGNTIFEALEKITLDSPKELYLGHNEVVVINDELAKETDPLDFLDYFMRESKVEKDSYVMIAKDDKAYDVLKIITPLETIPSRNLKATLSIADTYSGTLVITTIDEFISDLSGTGKDAIIPSVSITGDKEFGASMENIKESDPKSKLKFDTLAFFENNKLKGYLTKNESMGYNFLNSTANKTYINIKCDDENYASLQVLESKLDENIKFKNNKPIVNANIDVKVDLLEYNCKADFIKDEKYIKELEKKASSKIKKYMNEAVKKLYIENKSDALKYGSKFYEQKYKEMKKLNLSKKDIIDNISFNFKSKVDIQSTELTIRSIKE